jgi:2-keto-3-deoxy-L-rhamnonate aldolase RhmA
MQVYGLTMDTAAILLSGGILSIGLGGVIGALLGNAPAVVRTVDVVPTEPEAIVEAAAPPIETPTIETPAPAEEAPARIRFNGFGRRAAATATGVAATAAVATETVSEAAAAPIAESKSAVDDTIAALEQAKADIANAIGGVTTMAEAKVEEVVEDVEEEVEEADGADGELYVLEEREIRGRPARILSDNTVEAETDEGWMRFENLDHLNEYLDAAGEPA